MEFKLVHFLPDNWLHAIGLTLFHSLWIGLVLSVVTAVIVLLTRKQPAAVRYQLLTACLCLFVVAMGITLSIELDRTTPKPVQQYAIAGTAADQAMVQSSSQVNTVVAPMGISTKIDQLLQLWNSYATQIVLIWFLIICAKSVHLLLGLNSIFYLKRNKIFEAGKVWEHKLNALAQQLQIAQQIRIVQSGIAKVPMVIGHFKPLILIPIGLLNNLSMAEVEAILCHELAHIKRRDYLVNLLQCFIEVIFFFNPAVLWVSKLIRTERENCCDDIALGHVTDKKDYVKALLSCQEFQTNAPDYAMALTGNKSELINRVSRMLFNTRSTLNRMEKIILTFVMIFAFLFSATFSNAENQQVAPGKKPVVVQDTTKRKAKKIAPISPVTKKVSPLKGAVKNLSVKETARLDSTNQRYADRERIFAANEAKFVQAQKQFERNQVQYRVDRERHVKNEAVYKTNEERYRIAEQHYQAAQDQYRRDAKRYTADSLRYEEIKRNVAPATPTSPAPIKPAMTSPKPLKPLNNSLSCIDPLTVKPVSLSKSVPVNINLNKNVAVKQPANVSIKQNVKTSTKKSITLTDGGDVDSDELSNRVNNELLQDGIISQTQKLSYKLDKDGLFVNGKKQTDALHSKYKTKYLKNTSSALLYNYEVNTR